jgi:cytochrome oxidase Cu insertion factor (SCO1/SenC/PrrC family)
VPENSTKNGFGALIVLFLVAAGVFVASYRLTRKPDANPGTVGLEIGQIAPDIAGEDLDGKPFKLSDYHGKVIVLDFWGNW